MRKLAVIFVVLLAVPLGCKNGAGEATEAGPSAGEAEQSTETADDESAEGESGDEAPAKGSEAKSADDDEGAAEEAASPTEYDAEALPEGVGSKKNVLDKGLKWNDSEGANLLVFEYEASTVKPEGRKPSLTDSLLTVTHWRQPDDGDWEKLRSFEERVDQCSEDGGITPMIGEWSLTDLDEDGVNEATFAYTAGCRSDMSPITHKVLVTEDGQKWVLRGKTVITVPSEPVEYGEITGESGFEEGDEAIRSHAGMVWKETSNERLNSKYD